MDVTKQGIIVLLKSAITAQALPLPGGFDIQAALPLARQHHMSTMIYDGAVRCGVPRGIPAMQKLFQSYCRALQVSEGQMAEFYKICRAFDDAQIDYMPLKGCRMKLLYPKPELRLMGDVDILIRMEQYAKIRPLAEALGYTEKSETDHELIWTKPTLYLELHKRVISSYNSDLYGYFGEGWGRAKVANGTQYALSKEDEFIYLFAHYVKHYRAGGIGCRHVVDLWVYQRENPDMDYAYIEAELDKLGLLKFYKNTMAMIALWFGDGKTSDLLEFMTEYIFNSGSWGETMNRIKGGALRDARRLHTSARTAYIIRTLFPEVHVLRKKYKILQKAPWMLPVVWIIRPFYKVLFERKSLESKKRDIKALGSKRLEKERYMLQYVGLGDEN